jgi:DNA-binding SARP family transcriptional activator
LNDLRAGLEAQRLAAELDRNELALAHGRHAALVEELSARAAVYPLDERLAGQLILALYRCGRQAEALRQFERLRRGLADELGVDPGPPLRQLHQQILTADTALGAVEAAPAHTVPWSVRSSVPRQLPAPPGSFTGRARELAALRTVTDATGEQPDIPVVVALSGTAGVGKTEPGS